MRLKELFFALSPKRWLLRVLHGILIGVGAILPGISGGVLCVSFGLYQPMMALFAHPFQNFKKCFPPLFPAGIGWIIGFFAFANVLTFFFSADSNLATWLFIGLIAGTLPGLYRRAGTKGRGGRAFAAFALSFLGMLLFFSIVTLHTGIQIVPNFFWYGVCGAMWGLSLVLPGMSSSSILIFLGLFESMTAGVAAFDMRVVVPMFCGVALTVAFFARLVNRLFDRHFTVASHLVLGFVLASIVAIVPMQYIGILEVIKCLVIAAVGFFAAYWMDKKEHARG